MNKRKVIEAFKAEIREQLRVLVESAQAAHGAATHEESKPEDKYDTRGLEASYLAGAQSKRVMERQQQLTLFEHLEVLTFGPEDPILATALVTLASESQISHFLLMPFGGGLSVTCEGTIVRCITPQSPLGKVLLGKRLGDEIEVAIGKSPKVYEIVQLS